MKQVLIFTLAFNMLGCAQSQKTIKTMDTFEQYACLLKRSFEFLDKGNNEPFFYRLNDYLDTTDEYDFNSGRTDYVILHPFLLNTTEDRAIILILNRCLDLNDTKVERVMFVSAKLENGSWIFKVRKGFTRSFSYEFNHPILSDQIITLRVLSGLIQEGYLKKNTCIVDDDFFKKSGWFVLDNK